MTENSKLTQGGSLGSITFKVITEDLNTKATEVSDIIAKIEREFGEINEVISKTKGYWSGEAGDDSRNKYLKEKESFESVIHRLKEHPLDLCKIASKYANVEMQVEEIVSELPNDVIV